jgi:methyl-coenzyme M reductase subunit D
MGEIMEEIKAVDIQIFPYRYLKPETTERVLNSIYSLGKDIIRVIIHGQSLPKYVYYGPARGTPVNHPDRKVINVNGKDVELTVKVGKFIITVPYEKSVELSEKLDEICKKAFPFGYNLNLGAFTKVKPTVSDYLKYGEGFEDKIDPRLIGMADPTARTSDKVKMIKGD